MTTSSSTKIIQLAPSSSTLTQPSTTTTTTTVTPPEQKSWWSSLSTQKLKQYGKVGLITHLSISWTILGITYLIISRTGQAQKIIKRLNLQSKIPKQAGSLAVAGIIYKAIMPARIALSLMVIPILINKFDLVVQPLPQELEQGLGSGLGENIKEGIKEIKSQAGIRNTKN